MAVTPIRGFDLIILALDASGEGSGDEMLDRTHGVIESLFERTLIDQKWQRRRMYLRVNAG
ncbi:hypothetical protein [Fulvimarina sp. MAC8]|uniref:hypothetical protein n=1 Tax=Fulvimarina sp. MAC8 TaxID=3162874 RepID=UPI0032ED8824